MIAQSIKDFYYFTVGKMSFFSYLWHRWNPGRFSGAYLNVGCGPKYIAGMVNIDGNFFRKKDMWLDINWGMPFADDTIQGIYICHVAEHLYVRQLRKLFKEFHRVLKKGGAARIIVPSLEIAVDSYVNGRFEHIPDWPDLFKSRGGKFHNFLMCDNQHRTLLDFSFVEELLAEAGFTTVVREDAHHSRCFNKDHMQFESFKGHNTSSLYVEGIK